jgi:SecD/SecF fusion protein
MLRALTALAVIAVVALASASAERGSEAQAAASCAEQSAVPSLELVYELKAGEETVTQRTRAQTEATLCARLQTLGVSGGTVGALGKSRIRVLLPTPPGSDAQHLAAQLGTTAQLGFYDWEASLIGPELTIGGWPGRKPKASALKRAEGEWRAAGRTVERRSNRRLILAGAFPSAYGAVELASRQRARSSCASCSASKSRFYMFDRSAAHELIAGPVVRRADLRGAGGQDGIVLRVPVGTTIASEQPINGLGQILTAAEPGWYALKDRPALTAADILDPKQEVDFFGQPNVTFDFTPKGRAAFEELTRRVAFRGRAGVFGPVTASEAAALSHHIAILFDHEVKVRPIIDFANFPKGIDGRTGAQISGGFSSLREAQDLATILRTGSLPVDLALIRQRSLPAQNS